MLMPSIWDEDFFDDFMTGYPFFDDKDLKKMARKMNRHHGKQMMKTDIKENADEYKLEMDLPGFTKDEINVSLEDGYLTVSAAKGAADEDEKKSKYIRRERYAGACQRTFYVGDDVSEDDIKCKFKHGVLKITIPKKDKKAEIPENNNYITIEG